MSENATETEQQPTGTQQPNEQEAQQSAQQQNVNDLPQWARDTITKANNEAAKYRNQVRDLEPKAKQFADLEEASKSELQRQEEAVTAATRRAESAEADALRFRVAAEYGIGKDDLDLLGVGDEEQLQTRAARIAEMRSAVNAAQEAASTKPPTQRPTEQLRPGATPSNEVSDEERLYQSIYGSKQ